MSRIGQMLELKALREAVAELKQDVQTLKKLAESSAHTHLTADQRLNELEAKRGPGRARNDAALHTNK